MGNPGLNEIAFEQRRAIGIKLLERFDAFARENGLTYWIFWGTLLGAVRHKGMIPWDDDVDIAMPQKDYLRCLELMKHDPLAKDNIQLLSFELNSRYSRPFAKLSDTRTVVRERFDLSFVEEGVSIDIFPLVPVLEDEALLSEMRKRWRKDFVMMGLSKGPLVVHRNPAITIGKMILKPFAMVVGYAPFVSDVCKDIGNLRIDISQASSVLCVEEKVCLLDASWFRETVLLPFEHMSLPAPARWGEVLTAMYGDYMTPPAEEDRRAHCSDAFWKEDEPFGSDN